jgi:hypothetical protein
MGPRGCLDVLKKDKNHFPHLGIGNLDLAARTPVNIQTALSQLIPSPSNLLNCPAPQLLAEE